MRVILSAMGRVFLRTAVVTFIVMGAGIWAAPNLDQALALAAAASIASLDAAFRAIRVFVPELSAALAGRLGLSGAEVVLTAIQTFLAGLIAMVITLLSAPDLNTARAAGAAGLLAIGTGLWRVIQAWLTPGEGPMPGLGIGVPPQPVAATALPEPM